MAMTRKHYRQIADILAGDYASAGNDGERLVVRNITLSLADVMKRDNPSFDRQRFYAAVGIDRRAEPATSGAFPDALLDVGIGV